jgi:hypothetical protein
MIDKINSLATSPISIGIMILLTNVGSRFVVHEFSDDDREYSQNILFRRLVVFAVCFVGTRDLVVSIILTAAFVVLAGGLFRGKGPFSREGMENPKKSDKPLRDAAGLLNVDAPAYDKEIKPMFE